LTYKVRRFIYAGVAERLMPDVPQAHASVDVPACSEAFLLKRRNPSGKEEILAGAILSDK